MLDHNSINRYIHTRIYKHTHYIHTHINIHIHTYILHAYIQTHMNKGAKVKQPKASGEARYTCAEDPTWSSSNKGDVKSKKRAKDKGQVCHTSGEEFWTTGEEDTIVGMWGTNRDKEMFRGKKRDKPMGAPSLGCGWPACPWGLKSWGWFILPLWRVFSIRSRTWAKPESQQEPFEMQTDDAYAWNIETGWQPGMQEGENFKVMHVAGKSWLICPTWGCAKKSII